MCVCLTSSSLACLLVSRFVCLFVCLFRMPQAFSPNPLRSPSQQLPRSNAPSFYAVLPAAAFPRSTPIVLARPHGYTAPSRISGRTTDLPQQPAPSHTHRKGTKSQPTTRPTRNHVHARFLPHGRPPVSWGVSLCLVGLEGARGRGAFNHMASSPASWLQPIA